MELDVILVAIRRRWPWIVGFLAVGAALAFLLPSGGPDRFQSTALVEARPAANIVSPALNSQPDRYVQGEIAVLSGSGIRSQVAEATDSQLPSDISIDQIESSDIIEISVTTGNPERSQEVAQSFADVYLEQARGQVDLAFAPEISRLEAQLRQIEADLLEVNQAIAAAARPFINAAAVAEIPQPIPDVAVIDPASVARQQLLLGDLQQTQAELAQAIGDERTAFRSSLIEPANLPVNPLGNSTTLLRIGVLVAFALLGLAASILATRFSRVFLDEEALEQAVGRPADIRVKRSRALAGINGTEIVKPAPHEIQREIDRLAVLVELRHAQNSTAEPTLVLLGGATLGAGSTTVATQLAATLSRRGSATMLVDGDVESKDATASLRAPTGWSLEEADLRSFAAPHAKDLYIVGTTPDQNGSEIVAMVDSVYEQQQPIDIIVVDLGNLRRSAVAAKLAPVADWLVLCVPERNQSKRDLQQTVQTYGATDNLLLAFTGARAPRSSNGSSSRGKNSTPKKQTRPRQSSKDSPETRDILEAA